MDKSLVSADKIQTFLLEQFYQAWAIRPGPTDFFPAQQIWDKVTTDLVKILTGR